MFNVSFFLTKTIHQHLPDYQQRANEMSIVRQKSIPVLACQIFRVFDLIKEDQEIFRLIVFLSDHREQQLYKVTSFRLQLNSATFIFLLSFCCFSCFQKMHLV